MVRRWIKGIVQLLMVLYRETGQRKYLQAAGPALRWLEKSVLPRPANASEVWRRIKPEEQVAVTTCSSGKLPALARFYELKTNRPLFITKGTQITARGLGSKRIDGYQVSYSDESVITHYGVLTSGARLKAMRNEFDTLEKAAQPKPRPERLHGLSPWSEPRGPLDRKAPAARVKAIVAALDGRGAWVEDGVIGKSDRLVTVNAARPMVLTINGKPIEVSENDRIELFQGTQAPRQKIIRSTTFATQLEALAASISTAK